MAFSVHDLPAGSARLYVVIPVATVGFFYASMLDYALPLYFSASNHEAVEPYPANIWSEVIKYQILPFTLGPMAAGLLSRRYGERYVWGAALAGKVIIPLWLMARPSMAVVRGLALWQGLTASVMWIAGLSLAQMVHPARKGFANGMLMAALGIGSFFGPMVGRALIYNAELRGLLAEGRAGEAAQRLLNLRPMAATPALGDFRLIFLLLTITTLVSAVAIAAWGQRAGDFDQQPAASWAQTLSDLARLARLPRFWALVLTMCVLGGPLIQSSNQFLPYRAEALGLKQGAMDAGWIWLNLLKTLMWLPGGLAVGLVAGRRAAAIVPIAIQAAFCAATFGVGFSQAAWQLFASVAAFEFLRQCTRWVYTGYLSEHMPSRLRATAIGLSVSFAGTSSALFAWVAGAVWNPNLAASRPFSQPFLAAVAMAACGCAGLFVFNLFQPIRQPEEH
jgi:MFS family permease